MEIYEAIGQEALLGILSHLFLLLLLLRITSFYDRKLFKRIEFFKFSSFIYYLVLR